MTSSKSTKSYDRYNVTQSVSGVSSIPEEESEDTMCRLKQLRRTNKKLKVERDEIGEEYDKLKKQCEESEADKMKLLGEKKRYEREIKDLLAGHETTETLHNRVLELQRDNQQLKAEAERIKKGRDMLRTENEKLTGNMVKAIEERDKIGEELADANLKLKEMKRKLNDEIVTSSYAKEKAQKIAKQSADEIVYLKEHRRKLEMELHTQRVEFTTQLKQKEADIEELQKLNSHLTNEVTWLKANEEAGVPERRKLRLQTTGGMDLSDEDNSDDNSTQAIENSRLEDLDDFMDGIQKHRGKGMKEQSANPELLLASHEVSELNLSPKTVGGSRRGKSPKPRPSIMRRMSNFFFSHE